MIASKALLGLRMLTKKTGLQCILAVLCAAVLGAHSRADESVESPSLVFASKPLVVSSIRPIAIIVEQLAGDLVASHTLVDGSASPHHFALALSDAAQLKRAGLFVYIDSQFESFIAGSTLLPENSIEFSTLVGSGREREVHHENHGHETHGHENHGGHGKHKSDLHLWLDPGAVSVLALTVAERLTGLLPNDKALVAERLDVFLSSLEDVDKRIKQRLSHISGRTFVAFHDGYGEYVSHYQLNQVASVTLVPDEHISAKKLAGLKKKVSGSRCLMAEENEASLAQRYAEVLDLPLEAVDLLAANSPNASYEEYLSHVTDAFVRCLTR